MTDSRSSADRPSRNSVLVIEDDADIRELVRYNLGLEGFMVEEAADGAAAFASLQRSRPAVLILDLMLPGMPGLEICRKLRENRATADLPILILTAKSSEADRVIGLESGADDYVVKPFSPRELAARVKALVRRAEAREVSQAGEIYERGGLKVAFATYEVWVNGLRKDLSLREFELLRFFVQNPSRVYSRGQLLDLVWGPDTYVEPRTVDVHVRRLRAQIERDDANPELILTVRGVGYRFDPGALG